jgi:hypothetical protein
MLQADGTLEEMEAGVAGSPEYCQLRGGSTTEGFLGALYQDSLGRSLDMAGQPYWGQVLASGVNRGQVAAEVFAGPEFLQDLLQKGYQQFLHRSTDTNGLNYWLFALQEGMTEAQMTAGIIGSQEYLNRP